MSIFYPKTITAETATQKAMERLRIYKLQLEIVNKCLPIIKRYEGKKLTAHIATACQKELGEGFRASFDRNYGMYHLNVWPKEAYNDKVSMLLGYENSCKYEAHICNYANILDHNKCYTLNAERIPRLEAGISKIDRWVKKRDEAIALFQAIAEEAKNHEMEYDFMLDD